MTQVQAEREYGSVLVMVVFIVALMAAVVMGILQINTEEIQLMQNHVGAARAQAIAEAGLNDAFAQLRSNSSWDAGFADKPFEGGSYTVVANGSALTATGTTVEGFSARLDVNVTLSSGGPPYGVSIDRLRIYP